MKSTIGIKFIIIFTIVVKAVLVRSFMWKYHESTLFILYV